MRTELAGWPHRLASFKIMRKIIIALFLLFGTTSIFAQIEHPVKWSYGAKRFGKSEAVLFLRATIETGWHIYSAYQPDGGPIRTSFVFAPSGAYSLKGNIAEPAPKKEFEKSFDMQVSYFEREVIFRQNITLKSKTATVKGKLNFMVCNDRKCLPPEDIAFTIPVK